MERVAEKDIDRAYRTERVTAVEGKAGFGPLRQAQTVAGSMLLAAAFASKLWVFVLLVGAGLLLAGFTGLCPMERLLARMPWNKR